jgi:hypothetical protein
VGEALTVAPRLVDKSHMFPASCFKCPHSTEQYGPFLDTEIFDVYRDRRVYFCRHCTEALIRAVEVVPASKLKDMYHLEQIAEDRLREVSQLHEDKRALEEEIGKLKDHLAMACSERDANRRAVVEVLNRTKAERREQMLASVAANGEEPEPKPKPGRKH